MRPSGHLPVIDGHNDTLLNLYLVERGGGRSFFERSRTGHIDLPRAREAGLAAGFFSLFVPHHGPDSRNCLSITGTGKSCWTAPPIDRGYARDMTDALMAELFRMVDESHHQVSIVRSATDLREYLDNGTFGIIMHLEGADAIDASFTTLDVYHQAGLRSLGIVWSRPNLFGYGVPYLVNHTPDTGPGLTETGRKLVRVCNDMGIMLDLAHLNEKGFWEVASLSNAPLVVTHSAAYDLTPSSRNLISDQFHAIKETGGVVGVSFFSRDIVTAGRSQDESSCADIVRHITYIAELIGIDHVAFGSDFDGCTVPSDLKDVTGLPRLITLLRNEGFDDESLEKVTHRNWIRVLEKTWGNSEQ